MAILKCKMCGGTLEINGETTVCECEYCGSMQTIPKLDDESRLNLYDRANHFRRNNEYDKAMGIYERILNEDPTDAEAYWSLVLCQYGIEYVEDPATHKRIPTVNRAQYTSIFADENYKAAIANADISQKSVYENEAKAIDEIQKGILEISSKEEPFDVFICYKETDSTGRRTPDSVLANDLYHQLTQEGFKVFFSRITLEDKLGVAYEPYIFAALNSAKAMVVLGTKPEYFNAVWVKNEWSRYLALIKSGAKKVLIPAYKDMDPYDLPEEFSHLQAQDMSKLGFMQDLIRGIKKIIGDKKQPTAQKEPVVVQAQSGNNVSALLKRGNMALEDGDWSRADEFFEEVLNQDAECAEAYLGKYLASERVRDVDALSRKLNNAYIESNTELLFACEEATAHINEMCSEKSIPRYLEESIIREKYSFDRRYLSDYSSRKMQKSQQLRELRQNPLLSRARKFATGEFGVTLDTCFSTLENELNERIAAAKSSDDVAVKKITDAYKAHIEKTDKEICQLCEAAKGRRDEDIEKAAAKKAAALEQKKQITKTGKMIAFVIIVILVVYIVISKVVVPSSNYKKACGLLEAGEYAESMEIFEKLNGYKDSNSKLDEAHNLKVEAESILNCKLSVGDVYYLGKYYNEDIQWRVLAIEDGKALIITDNKMWNQKYNETHDGKVSWAKCLLRKWLNTGFYQEAFNTTERDIIAETNTADKGEADTKDNVFILSLAETQKYLENGTLSMIENHFWFRSPKNDYGHAQWGFFNDDGTLHTSSVKADNDSIYVRPAMWVKCE